MSITIGDILQVVAVLSWLDGGIMQNVFHTEVVGTGGPYDPQDITDDCQTWVEDMFAELVASMSDECDGSEVRVYVRDVVGDDWDEIGTGGFAFDPTGDTDQIPRGVAALVNAKTIDADINGKKYIGGYTEGTIVGGLLPGAEVAKLVLFSTEWVQQFVGGVSGATFDPGIWSPKNTTLYDMSNTIVIPAILAYQRRRKRGVGI